MKKLFVLLMILILLAACSACSNQGSQAIETYSSPFAHAEVGDIITFGRYEQDNNPDNGPEPIEWIVIDKQAGKILLLSKYCLDQVRYDQTGKYVTWETCTLRAWLNNDFLNTAFSEEEQKAILMTKVHNNAESIERKSWYAPSGISTRDMIFALSYSEASQYLGVKPMFAGYDPVITSRTSATEYAIAKGVPASTTCLTTDGEPATDWWLRTLGNDNSTASFVRADGLAIYDSPWASVIAVRPALWLDLNDELVSHEQTR